MPVRRKCFQRSSKQNSRSIYAEDTFKCVNLLFLEALGLFISLDFVMTAIAVNNERHGPVIDNKYMENSACEKLYSSYRYVKEMVIKLAL
jgi:hypothetical protein